MIKQFQYMMNVTILALAFLCLSIQESLSQESGVNIKGYVFESLGNSPLKGVIISVSSTGQTIETDSLGNFSLNVPNAQSEIIINYPGYVTRKIYINGKSSLLISLVPNSYKTFDNGYNTPYGTQSVKEATYAGAYLQNDELQESPASSYDQTIAGKVAGLHTIEHSGMPGHKSWLNIRGINSIYGKNEPLLFIDGMIHEYNYANQSLMEGFSLNPMDVIDVEDIQDVSVIKNGDLYFGAASANGVININTEQKSEASTVIKFSGYTGIATAPQELNLLSAGEYKQYLNGLLSENLTPAQIEAQYPWLNGNESAKDYYKYNNSTNWQSEIFKPGMLHKGRIFLKGGDDIATYNISAGYLKQDGLFDESSYSRFNLRINGTINISDKFSVTPNAKISLADSYLPNLGFSAYKNPILSAALMPPIMAPYAKNNTGKQLPYLDDVGVFNVSNPVAITQNAMGDNRNYHFLSSVKAQYKITNHFYVSNLIGISYNNARESIFLPDKGMLQIDSVANSPQDMVYEFRSLQNHTVITYATKSNTGHHFTINTGLRFLENSYKNITAIDLNTGSDDIKKLGSGKEIYRYLRSSTGDDRGLLALSYFGNLNYSFRNKYFINANIAYEGNSAVNEKNRYSIFPSVGVAWRLSSESFMSQINWLEDLKVRASWSQLGNMYSNVYDYSKLFLTERRYNNSGTIVREAIPNGNLELEKKTTLNLGFDVSLFRQLTNIHFDFYQSTVNNLIIEQEIRAYNGFTTYFDNGGKLESSGIEIALDQTLKMGKFIWTIGGTFATQTSKITGLEFINPNNTGLIMNFEGVEYIASVDNPVNAFYGYKTNGIFTNNTEANVVTGPKNNVMQAGDIRFIDKDGNNIINQADKDIIGDPNPDFFGGIATSLSYKKLKLTANFTYSIGNDIYNYVKYKTESMDNYYNQSKEVLNRWSSANPNGTLPRAAINDPSGNSVFSDRWIEDGSYFKLKKLTLSYKLPSNKLYNGITVYVTASNLLTLTKYTGYDPELMYSNSPFNMGIDYGMTPQLRSYIIGLVLDL